MERPRLTYAGIGSRRTPPEVLELMTKIGRRLAQRGWLLRSGGAVGADQAFFKGAWSVRGATEIYLPWPGYEGQREGVALYRPHPEAFRIAEQFHPAWGKLTEGGKKLHARNVHIVLGCDLSSPVRFIVCWTPGGKLSGGTAQALRIGQALNIPIVNLACPGALYQIRELVECFEAQARS